MSVPEKLHHPEFRGLIKCVYFFNYDKLTLAISLLLFEDSLAEELMEKEHILDAIDKLLFCDAIFYILYFSSVRLS